MELMASKARVCLIYAHPLVQLAIEAIVQAQIIELCSMSLELAPMVRSGVFLFSCFSEGLSSSFLLRFPPLSEVGNF